MPGRSMKIFKVIEGLKSWNLPQNSTNTSSKPSIDIEELLRSENFAFKNLITHGFPSEPNCVAFDPIQKILAIGNRNGTVKIFGKSEVEYSISHPTDAAVIKIIFLVNQGQFLTICQDDIVHLWSFKNKPPEIVQSLQFKRERVTSAYLSLKSNWLYVGTERGNVNFVNISNFSISGYIINWNKAIELSQSNHPGRVLQIAENPQENNKILIGYSSGFLVLWDLKSRQAEARYKYSDNLHGFSWNFEGKNFMTCHSNGILATWSVKQPTSPISIICPHSCHDNLPIENHLYEPIKSVEWIGTQNGEPFVLFCGGGCLMPVKTSSSSSDAKPPATQSFTNPLPSITVMRGKRLAVMQMDYPVIDFISLCESPYECDPMEPYAVSVLLESDLVVIDLLSPNYPSFENPYPIDLHTSPVTAIQYVSDCSKEFILGLYLTQKSSNFSQTQPTQSAIPSSGNENNTANSANNRASVTDCPAQNDGSIFSNRDWPITGGAWTKNNSQAADLFSELIITGHADGSIRFWNANGLNLVSVYKFRTCKLFRMSKTEWSKQTASSGGRKQSESVSNSIMNSHFSPNLMEMEEDPIAINMIKFCPESRKILLGSLSSAVLLKFSRDDANYEIPFIDVNATFERFNDFPNPVLIQNNLDDDVLVTGNPNSPDSKTPNSKLSANNKRSVSQSSYPSTSSYENKDLRVFLQLKPGTRNWQKGYQPELVCRLGVPSLSFELSGGSPNNDVNSCVLPPSQISSVSFNSEFGLMAFGNDSGIVVIDFFQNAVVLQFSTNDLYENIRPLREITRDNVSRTLSITGKHDPCEELTEQNLTETQKTLPGESTKILPHQMTLPEIDEDREFEIVNLVKSKSFETTGVPQAPGKVYRNSFRKMVNFFNKCDVGSSTSAKDAFGQTSTPPYSASSSISSLEQFGTDSVKILEFTNIPIKKRNQIMNRNALMIGTKLGSVLVFELNNMDSRNSQPVNIIPSGITFRHLGELICVDVIKQSGELYTAPYSKWVATSQSPPGNLSRSPNPRGAYRNSSGVSSATQSSSPSVNIQTCNLDKKLGSSNSSLKGQDSCVETNQPPPSDARLLVLISDKQIKVISFPAISVVYRVKMLEKTFICAAKCSQLNNQAYVTCYLSNGHFSIYSLPSLRCLGDFEVGAQGKPLVSSYQSLISFGLNHGLFVYMKNSRELVKISLSNDTTSILNTAMPDLYIPRPLPEPMKKNFFKSFFSTSVISNNIDKNELFGVDASNKSATAVVLNQAGKPMASLNERTNDVTSDIGRAKLAALERGEKLGQLDQQTEEMMNQAKTFSKTASALAAKYEKKNNRWGF